MESQRRPVECNPQKAWTELAIGAGGTEVLIEDTATGNPLTFITDISKPLKSLLIPFTPVQSGTGDPSPDNIRPILPWDGLSVYQSGADTSNPTETDISFPSPVYGGTLDVVSGVLTVEWAGVDLGSKSWKLRSENQNRQVWECVCNNAKFGTEGNTYTANAISSEFSLTTSSGVWSVGKFAPSLSSNDKVFIFVVPAGSYANATECKEAMDGIQLCYELSNSAKQEVQLTPAQITALVGDNTIWSDADGSMTCVYLVSSRYDEEHPLLGGGLGSGLLGSGTEDNPEDPIEDPEEEVPDNTEEGSEPDD